MTARTLWSPSRIKAALQCGRRLEGMEEGWPRVEHVRGIRGRAVHAAVERWESANREDAPLDHVADAWMEIADDRHRTLIDDGVRGLWTDEEKLEFEEQTIVEDLSEHYKKPRATKAFKERTAHLDPQRRELAARRAKLTKVVDAGPWLWQSDRGTMAEGFDHSLETVRRGVAFLRKLWPTPDIVGSEWHLESELDDGYRVHGFIDRVEATAAGVEVVDYKSSRWEDTELDHWLQSATYAVVAADHLGFDPVAVRFVYLRDQSSVAYRVDPSWRDALARQVASADRVLLERAFAPSYAGCGICSFVDRCRSEFPMVEIDESAPALAVAG